MSEINTKGFEKIKSKDNKEQVINELKEIIRPKTEKDPFQRGAREFKRQLKELMEED